MLPVKACLWNRQLKKRGSSIALNQEQNMYLGNLLTGMGAEQLSILIALMYKSLGNPLAFSGFYAAPLAGLDMMHLVQSFFIQFSFEVFTDFVILVTVIGFFRFKLQP